MLVVLSWNPDHASAPLAVANVSSPIFFKDVDFTAFCVRHSVLIFEPLAGVPSSIQ